jgi:hypothetical protein
VAISNKVKQREYATATLEFLNANPELEIDITAEQFNALYETSDAQTTGAKFGVAITRSMDKLFIRELIRDLNIPFKDFYRDQLTQTLRVVGTHHFIINVLDVDCPDSDLVAYSKARLDKVMEKLDLWSNKGRKDADSDVKPVATASVFNDPKLKHALEVVSAMREMRSLVDNVKIAVLEFDEDKIKKSCTRPSGKIDYVQVTAQLRHNHTDYDVLRVSRKIRRNTYWKLTAHPAIRIAVCEKLLLLTDDPAIHFRLMQEIQMTNTEFERKLMRVASAPNFTAAIDEVFMRTTKKKVVKKAKCDFMLCLQTL